VTGAPRAPAVPPVLVQPENAASRPSPRPRRDWPMAAALALLAVTLRLLMFAGRGDYIAFDEGWYLLLGRNLFAGDGYTLTGLTHTTLSPLFPVLAGAMDLLTGDIVWSGRIVIAVAAGLLVVPCWYLFRSLAGRRTALLGCILVIALPALAPFVAPYWIGWDLWVGAEPLLHVLLYSGLTLALHASLRTHEHRGAVACAVAVWLAAGVAFGLAFLARPEAILVAAGVGLLAGARAVVRRNARSLIGVAVLTLGFVVTALPYWIHLHDARGYWSLTGRGVELVRPAAGVAEPAQADPRGATETIEQMLWAGNQAAYLRHLYALDASRTRLASSYWGVQRAAPQSVPYLGPETPPEDAMPAGTAVAVSAASSGRIGRYVSALSLILPFYVWPFLILGAVPSRRRRGDELMVALPVAGASVAIAVFVAIDPRTQLFLLPLAAFYAARGLRRAGVFMDRRRGRTAMSRRFPGRILAAVLIVLLLGTQARRLYMSLTVGSPHHLVGAENRRIGETLRETLPAGEPVMSWHPAIALYAGRDWRVLPRASLPEIATYANAIGSEHVVLSAYYPSPMVLDDLEGRHLILHVPPAPAGTVGWQLRPLAGPPGFVSARLEPVP
jgi:4-amino-4-deoxy-L-arabinose transferase-like glycosyltransferase